MVHLDFSKAFDSVSHELLIHGKLSSFDFYSDLTQWFQAYLTGRPQRVDVDGVYSDWPVVSGVPRRAILSNLLFVLYINNLPSVAQIANVALFADDAKYYISTKSQNDLHALELGIRFSLQVQSVKLFLFPKKEIWLDLI